MSSPEPASFDTVANRQAGNVRKPLRGTVLLGKHGDAPVITTLVSPNGQILMPSTYESAGWISEDGLTFAKEREFSEIRGWGSASFLRRDIVSEEHTLQFAAIETKRLVKELTLSQNLEGTEMSTDGEWKADILTRPNVMHWRACAIGVDGSGESLFYMAKVYHKMTVTEMDDEAWTDGDDPLAYNVTLAATPDETTGTLGTEFLFGPGALARAEQMGLTVASA